MTERDFVTYLTWPSDQEVIDLMHRLGAGWILLHSNPRLEIDYHDTWLFPTYSKHVRHVEKLAVSHNFCHVSEINGYHLYRLGPCRPGEPTGPFAPEPGSIPYQAPTNETGQGEVPDARDERTESGVPPTPSTSLAPAPPGEGAA